MHESLASRINPAILYMLDELDWIRGRRGEVAMTEVASKLKNYLGRLDNIGRDSRESDLAKRALVYWFDEMLVHADWKDAKNWQNNLLEFQFYKTHDRAIDFFGYAEQAKGLPGTDVLELYYLCVALGFRGIYRSGASSIGQKSLGPLGGAPVAKKSAGGGAAGGNPAAGKGPTKLPEPVPEISWFNDPKSAATPNSLTPSAHDSWAEYLETSEHPESPRADGPPENPRSSGSGASEGLAEELGRTLPDDAVESPNLAVRMRNLPGSLDEWAKPVYTQIVPGAVAGFNPSLNGESPRSARPLSGARLLGRSLAYLGWLVLSILILGLIKVSL